MKIIAAIRILFSLDVAGERSAVRKPQSKVPLMYIYSKGKDTNIIPIDLACFHPLFTSQIVSLHTNYYSIMHHASSH
jgi:hypothetical protein